MINLSIELITNKTIEYPIDHTDFTIHIIKYRYIVIETQSRKQLVFETNNTNIISSITIDGFNTTVSDILCTITVENQKFSSLECSDPVINNIYQYFMDNNIKSNEDESYEQLFSDGYYCHLFDECSYCMD